MQTSENISIKAIQEEGEYPGITGEYKSETISTLELLKKIGMPGGSNRVAGVGKRRNAGKPSEQLAKLGRMTAHIESLSRK